MLQHYEDILSRIAEPPRWFDEQGVPRYCEFAPHRIANIHARRMRAPRHRVPELRASLHRRARCRTANHNVIEQKSGAGVAHARRHHPQPRDPIRRPAQCRLLWCRSDPDEQSPPRARILGAYSGNLYRPRLGPARDPRLARIGRATTALKSRYRTGNRCWRSPSGRNSKPFSERPDRALGSRAPSLRLVPGMRVTIPCARVHGMSRRLIGSFF
jgi:hypothetical protein